MLLLQFVALLMFSSAICRHLEPRCRSSRLVCNSGMHVVDMACAGKRAFDMEDIR